MRLAPLLLALPACEAGSGSWNSPDPVEYSINALASSSACDGKTQSFLTHADQCKASSESMPGGTMYAGAIRQGQCYSGCVYSFADKAMYFNVAGGSANWPGCQSLGNLHRVCIGSGGPKGTPTRPKLAAREPWKMPLLELVIWTGIGIAIPVAIAVVNLANAGDPLPAANEDDWNPTNLRDEEAKQRKFDSIDEEADQGDMATAEAETVDEEAAATRVRALTPKISGSSVPTDLFAEPP